MSRQPEERRNAAVLAAAPCHLHGRSPLPPPPLRLSYGLTAEEGEMLRCSEGELRCKLADVPPATAGGLAAVLEAAFVGLQQVATDYGNKRELAMHRARKRNDEQQRLRFGPAGPPPRAIPARLQLPGAHGAGHRAGKQPRRGATAGMAKSASGSALGGGAGSATSTCSGCPRCACRREMAASPLRCERPLRHGSG